MCLSLDTTRRGYLYKLEPAGANTVFKEPDNHLERALSTVVEGNTFKNRLDHHLNQHAVYQYEFFLFMRTSLIENQA